MWNQLLLCLLLYQIRHEVYIGSKDHRGRAKHVSQQYSTTAHIGYPGDAPALGHMSTSLIMIGVSKVFLRW